MEGRRQRLEDWVKNGGRLIVDRSLGGEEAFASGAASSITSGSRRTTMTRPMDEASTSRRERRRCKRK